MELRAREKSRDKRDLLNRAVTLAPTRCCQELISNAELRRHGVL